MISLKFIKRLIGFLLVLAFVFPNFHGLAIDSLQERQALEEELKELEEQIAQYEKDITKTKQEKETLQNKIYILRREIEKLNLQIYQSNLVVKDLTIQIGDTESSIEKTSLNIGDVEEKLVGILRNIYEEDQKSLVEILLSENDFSDFFNNLIALETLNSKSQEFLKEIKSLKLNLETQKNLLDEEKTDLERVVKLKTLQKQKSETTKKQTDYFLKLTEVEYQEYLNKKETAEKKASEIRAKIYELIGVRRVVTYEEALNVAKYAASHTGIRAALLLGVLSQESSIGKNVGQCYLKNPSTGEGVVASNGRSISRVMNPTRDVPYFLQIIEDLNKTKGLALDPYQTLVSCPMSFGWGGAMGPAQFIPSTWAHPKYGFKKGVEQITGTAADPWDIRDASLAASLYLKSGLDRYGTENKAVQSYFCGYPKNDYWCSWYAKNVLYLARCHQTFIDSGSMSFACQEAVGLR